MLALLLTVAAGGGAGCRELARELATEPTASAPEADRSRTFAAEYGRVFDAALAALQGQGYPPAVVDRANGLLATDFLVAGDNQTRRRVSLTVRRTADPARTAVVATLLEEQRGGGGAWGPTTRPRREVQRLYAALLDAIGRRLTP